MGVLALKGSQTVQLLIDHANLASIRGLLEYLPIDGVTTNPSILAREGGNPLETLRSIRRLLPDEAVLHAQAVATTPEALVDEARALRAEFGKNFYVKIPVTRAGLEAIKVLGKEDFPLTATGVYSPLQALIAAKAGARYAAPYVNRLDNMGVDGIGVAAQIHEIFVANDVEADVLAASFKNSRQILELARLGIGAVTASPDVLASLVAHAATTEAIEGQNGDLAGIIGAGRTMLDLLSDAG